MTGPVPVEFPRPLHLDDIGIGGADLEIEANADERDLLARRLDLVSLDGLTATVHVDLMENGTVIHVTGTLRADMSQSCVVTLEPVTTHIETTLDRLYSTDGDIGTGGAGEITLSPDIEDPPEPIFDGIIELGEAVAEQLALEIDPFPRLSSASFDGYSSGNADPDAEASQDGGAFAILARIKGISGSEL